jgi:L-ascorbate metabolism protein UlaG (beta-lactamase superfamily)
VPKRATYHPSDADLSITRIVHDTVLLELSGTRLLVDPWFYSGLLVRQREPIGIVPDDLPAIAAVMITHGHGDHLDERALRGLAATVPEIVARPELRARLSTLGFRRVTALDTWERTRVGPLTVTAVPARHATPENGYVVQGPGASAYLAGDTRWFDELSEIATRFPGLDVAVLPIGGERVLGLPRQMGPAEAARAAVVLGAVRIIPIGYGERSAPPLWWFARRPTERLLAECAEQGIERARVVVLEPGESWHYYR